MVKRAHPQNHIQAVFFAKLNKSADILTAGKVKNALLLLMVNPEHIGRHHVDFAHFHFNQLVLPTLRVHPAEMKFPAHAKEGAAVSFHIIVGEGNCLTAVSGSFEVFS